jgi:hypothetical protein
MADFPTDIYAPRTMVNKPGAVYDPLKTKIIFAEDFNLDRAEIVAIEEILGENPQGSYATVRAWLDALEAGGGAMNFGNLDGGLVISNFGAIDPVDGGIV